ncbi:MAG: hypothetical protein GC159_19815 [Phycisphaera sp.]|nr:hypothetical protein [Phycisphaera sp.]
MNRSGLTSRTMWGAAAVVALAVAALLPDRYASFSKPVSMAVITTVQPLSEPLHKLSASLRQHVDQPLEAVQGVQLRDKVLELENENYRLQWKVSQLEKDISALQKLDSQLGDRSFVYRRAAVSGRSADPSSNTLHLELGARDGVGAGMVVVEGAYLIGRVGQVGHVASTLDPITTAGTHVTAVIGPFSASGSGVVIDTLPLAQFDADGSDRLTAVIARSLPVQVGDAARLKDPAWPGAVHGWIIGQVIAVEDMPDDLLRKRVTIQAIMSLRYIDAVTVLVPSRGAAPGEGATTAVPLAGATKEGAP